jgi:MinD superfamily P-loop ATPase
MKKLNNLPPIIAVTGGKGGTGKTTVAVNLAYMFSKNKFSVLFLDCDVDAPNAAILMNAQLNEIKEVTSFLPKFNDKCIGCGDCQKVCMPHAILNIPEKTPLLFPEMCSGCEACKIICKHAAIESDFKVIGYLFQGTKYGIDLIVGELKIGEPKSAEVVRAVREYGNHKFQEGYYDIIIIDTAPGAHCDIIHALDGANLIVSVTEPTPFGEHDLKRILKLIQFIPSEPTSTIVINRSDLTEKSPDFDKTAETFNSSIIGTIPMSREIQLSYAEGIPVFEKFPEAQINLHFKKIYKRIVEVIS